VRTKHAQGCPLSPRERVRVRASALSSAERGNDGSTVTACRPCRGLRVKTPYLFSLSSAGAHGWGKIRYQNGFQCFWGCTYLRSVLRGLARSRFSICRIAELYSAERRIGPTHLRSPTSGRVELCDTAEYNSALRPRRNPSRRDGCMRIAHRLLSTQRPLSMLTLVYQLPGGDRRQTFWSEPADLNDGHYTFTDNPGPSGTFFCRSIQH
jgi:hypothetical protein